MSHTRIKTTFKTEGSYGSYETHTLYAWHNNSCDVVMFYDENGDYILSFETPQEDNLLDAIERLTYPNKPNTGGFVDNVEYWSDEDRKLLDSKLFGQFDYRALLTKFMREKLFQEKVVYSNREGEELNRIANELFNEK